MPIAGDFQAGSYGEADRMLAVAFLERALPDEWNQEDDAGIGGVSTSDLIQAVQTARSEGGFAVGGLQLTREVTPPLPPLNAGAAEST